MLGQKSYSTVPRHVSAHTTDNSRQQRAQLLRVGCRRASTASKIILFFIDSVSMVLLFSAVNLYFLGNKEKKSQEKLANTPKETGHLVRGHSSFTCERGWKETQVFTLEKKN